MKFKLLKILFILFTILSLPKATGADDGNFICPSFPCEKTVEITAYYSPLPDQKTYFTGSYEGDIRLNGDGVLSADNTVVYPGMIAAPKTYPFGTKIEIPKVGLTTVHDRGGAIVQSGSERGNQHDRIDIWMGHGDEGLTRAKKWGRRTLTVNILGKRDDLKDHVDFFGLENDISAPAINKIPPVEYKYFPFDLSFGDQNDYVVLLQNYLMEFLYLYGTITGIYDEDTLQAVLKYQMDNKIIENENSHGAGRFGPKTRENMEKNIEEYEKNRFQFLEINIGKNQQGEEVKKLQTYLIKLNYLPTPQISGIYDQKTIEAVYKFQIQNKIIQSELDQGAGYFGPKTRTKLKEILTDKKEYMKILAQNTPLKTAKIETVEIIEFSKNLNFGDTGEEVKKLQNHLKKLGFFTSSTTGIYGEITQNAVFKFQQSQKIVHTENEIGAGKLGPETRSRLNTIIGIDHNILQQISLKKAQKLN
ncbi:MAG: SpoIID/LytB domain-containing protein [Candidatus Peregrinibacteria bacterium GW2011_GWC2_33_13]|nr:MAG: SpoIID/LytB domain-containing protein [Candidatus Peregrinibacteria bacterium GW2011_GWC2_33_13]